MSLHDSAPPVDPEVRASHLLHLASTFRAFGEELASVGRVTGDAAMREYGERHIGLSDWLYRQACRWGKQAATTTGGGAPGADGTPGTSGDTVGTDGGQGWMVEGPRA